MKATRTWVVIADGARARVLLHDGPGHGLKPIPGCNFWAPHLKDSDIVADRAGRTFETYGSGRHSMKPATSPHRHNKAEFARTLVEFLDRKHAEGEFDRLLIVAAPTTLGDLRPLLSKALKSHLIAELPKDLTQIPDEQIIRHVETFLAV